MGKDKRIVSRADKSIEVEKSDNGISNKFNKLLENMNDYEFYEMYKKNKKVV